MFLAWAALYSPGVALVRADEAAPPAANAAVPRAPAKRAPSLPASPEATGPSCQAGTGPIREVQSVDRQLAHELEILRARTAAGRTLKRPGAAEVVPLDGAGYRYGAPPLHRPPPASAARDTD